MLWKREGTLGEAVYGKSVNVNAGSEQVPVEGLNASQRISVANMLESLISPWRNNHPGTDEETVGVPGCYIYGQCRIQHVPIK